MQVIRRSVTTVVAVCCITGAAHSAILRVTETGAGMQDGSTWGNAMAGPQTALNGATSGDQIWVAEGTYKPSVESVATVSRSRTFKLKPGVKVYGGFAATETNLQDRDVATNVTILSGNLTSPTENAYHVVTAQPADAPDHETVLDGFTITGGRANVTDHYAGGGILIGGLPVIANCIFYDNQAGVGGAAHVTQCTGGCNGPDPAMFVNCVFYANAANVNASSQEHGGAVAVESANLELMDCVFHDNAADEDGGALYVYGDGIARDTSVVNCVFNDNDAADDGGAIGIEYGRCQIRNSILWVNAAGGGGDEVYIETGATGIMAYSDINAYASTGVDGGGTATFQSGMLDADPDFEDAANDDYHVEDTSPCIDAGHDDYVLEDAGDLDYDSGVAELTPLDFEFECRIVYLVDMGLYENDEDPCPGDLTGDGKVDIEELFMIIGTWGLLGGIEDVYPEACGNGVIDIDDLFYIIMNWTPFGEPGCYGGEGMSFPAETYEDCEEYCTDRFPNVNSVQWGMCMCSCLELNELEPGCD